MSLSRLGRATLIAGSLLLASCKLFALPGGAGSAGESALLRVPPIRLQLGEGVDEVRATTRLAEAAASYVEAREGATGHLLMKNRRHYEIRLQLDERRKTARLGLALVGHGSFEQVVAEDLQLAMEYRRVAEIARHVLVLPGTP